MLHEQESLEAWIGICTLRLTMRHTHIWMDASLQISLLFALLAIGSFRALARGYFRSLSFFLWLFIFI